MLLGLSLTTQYGHTHLITVYCMAITHQMVQCAALGIISLMLSIAPHIIPLHLSYNKA